MQRTPLKWAAAIGVEFRIIDRDNPPIYWGGRDPLVRVLGRGEKPSEPDYQALKRAMTPLLKAGVVAVDKPSGPGHAARYSLHLDP